MSINRGFWGLSLSLTFAACGPQAAPETASAPAIDSAAVQAAAAEFWPRWVAAGTAGDMAALGALMADSIRIDAKGFPPLVGRAAAVAAFETMLRTTKVNAETFTPEQTTAISNELAYQTGDYFETTTTAGKSQTEYGRYAAAIGKDADGQWRLRYVMAFADSLVPVKK